MLHRPRRAEFTVPNSFHRLKHAPDHGRGVESLPGRFLRALDAVVNIGNVEAAAAICEKALRCAGCGSGKLARKQGAVVGECAGVVAWAPASALCSALEVGAVRAQKCSRTDTAKKREVHSCNALIQ